LTSTTVAVDAVERVRRLEYRVPDTDQTAVVWNVVVRATLDDSPPTTPRPTTRVSNSAGSTRFRTTRRKRSRTISSASPPPTHPWR